MKRIENYCRGKSHVVIETTETAIVDIAAEITPEQAYNLPAETLASKLNVDLKVGLTSQEAVRRLSIHGLNQIESGPSQSLIQTIVKQFLSPLVAILAIASGLALAFDEWLEGAAIAVVILLNAVIGVFMELQAQRSMNALRKLAQPNVHVKRDGRVIEINTHTIVPGDLVFLEAGDIVPADGRLLESAGVMVDESALTGESVRADKSRLPLSGKLQIGDQVNMVFKGTVIVQGHGAILTTATGASCQLGKIQAIVQAAKKSATPLEMKLQRLSTKLIWFVVVVAMVMVLVGVLRGEPAYGMIRTAIALGIAAIPEGLPIVATIALSMGLLRLARHKVVVKRLNAVETLGETDVIFTDKTGTLTANHLTVSALSFDEVDLSVKRSNGRLELDLSGDDNFDPNAGLIPLITSAVLCNNASIESGQKSSGDPLEVALLELAHDLEHDIAFYNRRYRRVNELPFEEVRRYMATVHEIPGIGGYMLYAKGAPEVIVRKCNNVLPSSGGRKRIDEKEWLQKAERLAGAGLRVIAFAQAEVQEIQAEANGNLTLIGFAAFIDPPRVGVRQAIQSCHDAGIHVVMMTGDHAKTALNVGYKAGLIDNADAKVITGSAISEWMGRQPDTGPLEKVSVFARLDPRQKLELLATYQAHGHTVAMTGDGVNDTPALKKADIGIAMGERGTEAAKDVADMILQDDAFTSVTTAIRQGRGIIRNIRSFVIYLLSCNLSEIIVVAAGSLSSLAIPLLPLQILFLNMITDVFPALALGVSKEPEDVMYESPAKMQRPMLGRKEWVRIGLYALGLVSAVVAVTMYATQYRQMQLAQVNNLVFFTLLFSQLWHVFNIPSDHQSPIRNVVAQNKFVWSALAICLAIAVWIFVSPLMRDVLTIENMTFAEIELALIFSLIPLVLIQLGKGIRRIAANRRSKSEEILKRA